LKIGMLGGPLSKLPPTPGDYRRANLSKRVRRWFSERYGDKLKVDFTLGRAVVMLRGEAWLVKVPYVFGAVQVIIDRDIEREYPRIGVAGKGSAPTINLLRLVDGLTPAIAKTLSGEEIAAIQASFGPAFAVFGMLEGARTSSPLLEAAKQDLQSGAEICVQQRQALGFSRWHSLQGIEKILKAFVASRGGSFKRTHDLDDLAETAKELGASALSPDCISSIQCSASVRYDPTTTTIEQASTAHGQAVLAARSVLIDMHTLGATSRAGA
jgi:hypothetical protein